MSRQDADDDESSPESTGDGIDEAGDEQAARRDTGGAEGEAAGTTEESDVGSLEEIAEEPSEDVDELLEEITTTTETEDEAVTESEQEEVGTDLIEFIEETPSDRVAAVIRTLNAERAELREELDEERERADDLESRLSRKQADFQNYKKRQEKRMEEEKQRATEDLVERLLDVRDNLARALEQDDDADIRSGIESTLVQFDEEMDRENVEVIEPDLGADVDPQRHEVLITVESDQPEDTVAQLHRPGYEMAGKVLRPAQVAVSDGSGASDEDEE
ncbi:nucleotide exchange factor GrpE [Halovenus sp. HT40]|uniref:nucleotide exchange factor GrpE n=1 Tax=Halovenus sp. HT40 TaxID=3126691 RepID=UPI00300EDD8B